MTTAAGQAAALTGQPAVPSIPRSAYTRSQDRAAAQAAGFTEFLGKPAPPHAILRACQRRLGVNQPQATPSRV